MIEVIKAEDIPNCGDYDIDIHNAIIVPKGATNGDMIKTMFDCQEDEKQWGNDNIWVTFNAKNNPSYNFDLEWWNSPYKE